MYITWEDRKGYGQKDSWPLLEKPVLSFEYAWFLLTDETAQYVESHDPGVFNKDMSPEQIQEVTAFYHSWSAPTPEPYVPTVEDKVQEHKSAYLAKLSEGFLTSAGFMIDCMENNQVDFALRLQLEEAARAQDSTRDDLILVRDYNNVNHQVTFEEFKSICLELGEYISGQRELLWSMIDNEYQQGE